MSTFKVFLASILFCSVANVGVAAEVSKEVNVYSSRHYPSDDVILENFTKKTGIKVNVVQIKEAPQLVERVKTEGAKSPADLIVTVDVGNLWRAQDAGLFQPIKSKVINENVPANLRDPNGEWTALAVRARVLVFNKDKVKEADLAGYEDLALPKWKGRVLVRSSNHVYNQSLAASLVAINGPEKTESWAKGITANLARKPEGGDTDQIKAVGLGVGDVAIVNHYYVARLLASDKPEDKKIMSKVGIYFPNQKGRGAHINISGAGVVKTAPNKDNAVKLLEYLVSSEAQEQFAKGSSEYPVLKTAEVDASVKTFGKPKFDTLSLSSIGKNTPEAVKILDKSGWR